MYTKAEYLNKYHITLDQEYIYLIEERFFGKSSQKH